MRHRANSLLHIYGLNYVADHTNGKIYEMSADIFNDDGQPIAKQRQTATIHGGLFGVPGQKLNFDEVEFVIVSGNKPVEGLGIGPQPPDESGICASPSDLDQGDLLGVVELMGTLNTSASFPVQLQPETNGVSFNDTNVVCFTCFFTKTTMPAVDEPTYVMRVAGTVDKFAIYMNSDGHMVITGANSSNDEILNVSISNMGGSFADGELHGISGVVDLSDTDRRELWHNGTEITRSVYTSWNVYEDDIFEISGDGVQYSFGTDGVIGRKWHAPLSDSPFPAGDVGDSLGFISFDDACTLVPGAVWDSNGKVRDPQAWSGWYAAQPQVFFGPSFWCNSGKTAPATYGANSMELPWNTYYQVGDPAFFESGTTARQLNYGFEDDFTAA